MSAIKHSKASVGTGTTQIIGANPRRSYLRLTNDGGTAVYVKFGADAVLNEGIRLDADGGTLELSRAHGNIDGQAVNGIVAAGTETVLVAEAVDD